MNELPKFVVNVRCMTYNHSAYIEDALNGFCIQRTNFPYVCVVVDDASIDGEPQVIAQYVSTRFTIIDISGIIPPETADYTMVLAQNKENPNCYFAVYYLKYNHYRIKDKNPYFERIIENCDYVAFCEGDDYWTDPDKLQKQVSFLEDNTDYGGVYTEFKSFVQSTGEWIRVEPQTYMRSGYVYGDMIAMSLRIWTLTTCMRTSIHRSIPKLDPNLYFTGDRLNFLHLTATSKVKGLDDVTAVYRVLSVSASHFLTKKSRNAHQIKVLRLMLYYLKEGPQIDSKLHERLYKKYQIQMLPYCFLYCDRAEFEKLDIPFRPVMSIKYFVVYLSYLICQWPFAFRILSCVYSRILK